MREDPPRRRPSMGELLMRLTMQQDATRVAPRYAPVPYEEKLTAAEVPQLGGIPLAAARRALRPSTRFSESPAVQFGSALMKLTGLSDPLSAIEGPARAMGIIGKVGKASIPANVGRFRASAVKIGDQVFEGTNHAEAFDVARAAGAEIPEIMPIGGNAPKTGFVTKDGDFVSYMDGIRGVGGPAPAASPLSSTRVLDEAPNQSRSFGSQGLPSEIGRVGDIGPVYHGSTAEIKGAFKPGESAHNEGVFFTSNPRVASDVYAMGKAEPNTSGMRLTLGKMSDDEVAKLSQGMKKQQRSFKFQPEDYGDGRSHGQQLADYLENTFDEFEGRTDAWDATAKALGIESRAPVAGSNVTPAKLRMSNPLEVDGSRLSFDPEWQADVIARAKRGGHDGVIIRNYDDGGTGAGDSFRSAGRHDVYSVFDPRNIHPAFANARAKATSGPASGGYGSALMKATSPAASPLSGTRVLDEAPLPKRVPRAFASSSIDDLPDLEQAARQHFGTTDDPFEAGFITKDGELLDFSLKKDGGPGGSREEDHRAIGFIYPTEFKTPYHSEGSNIGYLRDFTERGNVRFGMHSGDMSIHVTKMPTDPQMRQIARAIREGGPEAVHIDFGWGDNLSTSVDSPTPGSVRAALEELAAQAEVTRKPRPQSGRAHPAVPAALLGGGIGAALMAQTYQKRER